MNHQTARELGLESVLDRICDVRNFDFRNYKRATLRRRIARRMAETRVTTHADYLRYLDLHPEEYDALIASMLIKVTSFFRDKEIWDELARTVIPAIIPPRPSKEGVRIWSAGCATGEEAYSIALLVAEHLGNRFATYPIKIFGTDLDEAAVTYARRGQFSEDQVSNVRPSMREKWFVRSSGGHALRKEIRRCVVFGLNNLVSDAPISRLDLLLCRNVFIYLDATLQKRVLTRFHYALRREGILVLGKSELIPLAAQLFEPIDLPHRIYRRDPRRGAPDVAHERVLGMLEQEEVARSSGETREEMSALAELYRATIDATPTPIIGTTIDGVITHWNRAAAQLWGRTEGEVSGHKLASLGLSGLSGELLIEKTAAVRDGDKVSERAEGQVSSMGGAATAQIEVQVLPLRQNGDTSGLLYAVQDITWLRGVEEDLRRANEQLQTGHEELQTTNEELQSSNEELETTNEELQSANEELQTTNEELQSTNEELETTNEELQSTNAELDAINRELAHRTDELNLLGFYQRTIIRSLSAAVVVLDGHGRISSWNLAAERLLGIPESEAVGQLLWTMRVPAIERTLMARIRRSLSKRRALRVEDTRYELPTGGKGTATVAAIPLVDGEDSLGSILILEDTTRTTRLNEENRKLKTQSVRRGR